MTNLHDLNLIADCARRALSVYRRYLAANNESPPDEFEAVALLLVTAEELLIVHRDIVPLRLEAMLAAPLNDFMHDIAGIHLNLQQTQPPRLGAAFLPRFAMVQ